MNGKAGNPAFQARLNLTEDGNGFVGTMSADGGTPVAVRGAGIEVVYHTERRHPGLVVPAVGGLHRQDRVGPGDSDGHLPAGLRRRQRPVRVTKVDRPTGETTLEMPAEFRGAFRPDSFVIVLASGSRSFAGTFDDSEDNRYDWRGNTAAPPQVTAAAAAPARPRWPALRPRPRCPRVWVARMCGNAIFWSRRRRSW
ncbi:hypothetical protein [Amycolatopsis sp. NBC_00438]